MTRIVRAPVIANPVPRPALRSIATPSAVLIPVAASWADRSIRGRAPAPMTIMLVAVLVLARAGVAATPDLAQARDAAIRDRVPLVGLLPVIVAANRVALRVAPWVSPPAALRARVSFRAASHQAVRREGIPALVLRALAMRLVAATPSALADATCLAGAARRAILAPFLRAGAAHCRAARCRLVAVKQPRALALPAAPVVARAVLVLAVPVALAAVIRLPAVAAVAAPLRVALVAGAAAMRAAGVVIVAMLPFYGGQAPMPPVAALPDLRRWPAVIWMCLRRADRVVRAICLPAAARLAS